MDAGHGLGGVELVLGRLYVRNAVHAQWHYILEVLALGDNRRAHNLMRFPQGPVAA